MVAAGFSPRSAPTSARLCNRPAKPLDIDRAITYVSNVGQAQDAGSREKEQYYRLTPFRWGLGRGQERRQMIKRRPPGNTVLLVVGLMLAGCTAQRTASPTVDDMKFLTKTYEEHPEKFPNDNPLFLMGLARAYIQQDDLDKAEPVLKRVVSLEDTNYLAHRILGTIYGTKQQWPVAAAQYEKAWGLGDTNSVKPLAHCLVAIEDCDKLKTLTPVLLDLKKEDIECVDVLMASAIICPPPDKGLFFRAIDGVTDQQILERDDTTKLAICGFEKFGETQRATELENKKPEKSSK